MWKLTILAYHLAMVFASDPLPFKTVFDWKYMEYNWPSTNALEQAIENEQYIPQNNAIAGIKLWKNKMYLTIPRWKSGIPVTLAVISATPLDGVTNPKLDPYPSWDMQTLNDCSAFQYVQSMEIDPLGRMWVLDSGRTDVLNSNPVTRCPPRLVILDLENNGAVLHFYEFPENVAAYETVLLNDIVLDHQDGGMAFITDSGADPGIIVYSLEDNKSWKFRHNSSMRAQAKAVDFTVDDTEVSAPVNVDGIALSPPGPNRLLYYFPLSSFNIYFVPVSVLKNSSLEKIDKFVIKLGRKSSQSDGMMITNHGVLYLGLLNNDAIAMWDSKNDQFFETGVRRVFRNHQNSQWPDTFAIDEEGRLWYVSNRLQNYFVDQVDITETNYRILSSTVLLSKSYQYLEDGSIPELPEVTGTKSCA